MTSESQPSSFETTPFSERLGGLVRQAWLDVKSDALNTPVQSIRPWARFTLSVSCKLVIDWVFAEITRDGHLARESLSKSYGYIFHQPSLISVTPTVFIPLHITPGASAHIGNEEILEGYYYTVLQQDIIKVTPEGKIFGLVMFR